MKVKELNGIKQGELYRYHDGGGTAHLMLVIQLHDDPELGQWANVMHCHTDYDKVTSLDVHLSTTAPTCELPFDVVVQTDLFTGAPLETLTERLGEIGDHEAWAIAKTFREQTHDSPFHITGAPLTGDTDPLWGYKVEQGKRCRFAQSILLARLDGCC